LQIILNLSVSENHSRLVSGCSSPDEVNRNVQKMLAWTMDQDMKKTSQQLWREYSWKL